MKLFTKQSLQSMLIIAMSAGSVASVNAEIVTGTCTNTEWANTHPDCLVTFKIDTEGRTLTLDGIGRSGYDTQIVYSDGTKKDFSEYVDVIDTIYVHGGITGIGDHIFRGLQPKEVYFPCTIDIYGLSVFAANGNNVVANRYTGYTLHFPQGSAFNRKSYTATTDRNGLSTANSKVQAVEDWDAPEAHYCKWITTEAATCLADGTETSYCINSSTASGCPKYASSATFETRDVKHHVDALTHVEAVSRVSDCVAGVDEHYKCNECGLLYADAEGQTHVSPCDVIHGAGISSFDFKGSDPAPLYRLDEGSFQVFLYKPEEVGVTGKIKSIAFYVSEPDPDAKMLSLEIRMATTDKNDLSTKPAAGTYTQVYAKKTITLGKKVGWEEIELDKPFDYDGTKNLCVVVLKSGMVSAAGYGCTEFTEPRSAYYNVGAWTAGNYGSAKVESPSHLLDMRFTVPQEGGHKFETVAQTDEKCLADGILAHEHCTVCGNDYALGASVTSVEALSSCVIPAHVDALTHVDGLAKTTCFQPWVKEHFECGKCHLMYWDAEALDMAAANEVTGLSEVEYRCWEETGVDPEKGQYAPFHSDKAGSCQVFLFKPEEVGVKGDISKIAFYVTGVATANVNNNVEIRMAMVDIDNLNTKPAANLFKQVYYGTKLQLGQSVGWEEFVFQNKFHYDGTKNLCIVVLRSGAVYGATYGYKEFWVDADGPSRAMSDSGPASDGNWGNYSNNNVNALTPDYRLPDIRFTMDPVAEHKFKSVKGTDPTCVAEGIVAHEHCVLCGSDYAAGGDATSDKDLLTDLSIAALGHSYVTYDNAAAKPDEDGLYHTECGVCAHIDDPQRYAKVVISSKGYTTVFYDVPLHSEGDAAESFAVSEVKDDAFMLTPVENLSAAEGYVVKGTPNAVYWFPEQEEVAGEVKSLLGGTTEATSCNSKEYYVLGVGANSQKVGFYPYAGTRLSAYKAYYKPADDNGAEGGGAAQMAGFRMEVKGSADAETAIEELNAEAAEEVIYDLSGRKVSSPKKGQPYIKAGKKIIF